MAATYCGLLGTPQPLALSSVRTSAQDLDNSSPTLDEVFFLLPKWSFGTRRSEAWGSHLCGRNFIARSGWWKQIYGPPPQFQFGGAASSIYSPF
jgi:hypothetical protein